MIEAIARTDTAFRSASDRAHSLLQIGLVSCENLEMEAVEAIEAVL